tara:strand:- start:989 stop:1375 length:387 start_codon:yes stop_codon:yes gene_type:complete
MDFRQSFHYETAHVADTYKELLQIPLHNHNSVLTNLIAQNKVSGSTNVSVKIQYLSPADGTTTTDLELIETMALATTVTHSFMNTTFASTNKLGVDLHLPSGAKIFIKSSVLNALNVVATVKHYASVS